MAQDKKFPGIGDAWYNFHNGYNAYYQKDGDIVAKAMMGLHPHWRIPGLDVEKAEMESYGYHLLARKMKENLGLSFLNNKLKPQNPALFFYDEGCCDIYGGRDYEARNNFAFGMFIAAQLTPTDYKRLNKVDINIEWEGSPQNWIQNAEKLGQKFVWMDLSQKEKVLNIGIGQKKNYDEEGVYWNLGFYILADWHSGNKKEALELRNNKNSYYYSLFTKFKYDTASNKLS